MKRASHFVICKSLFFCFFSHYWCRSKSLVNPRCSLPRPSLPTDWDKEGISSEFALSHRSPFLGWNGCEAATGFNPRLTGFLLLILKQWWWAPSEKSRTDARGRLQCCCCKLWGKFKRNCRWIIAVLRVSGLSSLPAKYRREENTSKWRR